MILAWNCKKRCEYFLIPTAAESWFVCVWLICVALKTISRKYKNLSHLGYNIRIRTYANSPQNRGSRPHCCAASRWDDKGAKCWNFDKKWGFAVQVGAILGLRVPVHRLGKTYMMWRLITGCSFCNASRRCIAEQSALWANKWVTMWDPD